MIDYYQNYRAGNFKRDSDSKKLIINKNKTLE